LNTVWTGLYFDDTCSDADLIGTVFGKEFYFSSRGVEEEDHEREDKSGCGGLCKIKSFLPANLKLISG
jgi:hypothetical protein